MKSTVCPLAETKTPKWAYPCILQLKDNSEIIVLFPERGQKGIVLRAYNPNRIGRMEDWLPSDSNYWEEFRGVISLSN